MSSDAFEWTPGESFSAGGFLDQPGTFHCVVMEATTQPTTKKGALIDNAILRLDYMILAGTCPSQVGKSGDLLFFAPKPVDEEKSQEFAKKKIDRCLLAINQLKESDAGSNKKMQINIANFIGQQFVVEMEANTRDTNGREVTYIQMKYANIFHVDDPVVKDVPKDEEALKMLPSEFRRIGSRPEAAKPASKPAAKPASKPAAKPPVDNGLDDVM